MSEFEKELNRVGNSWHAVVMLSKENIAKLSKHFKDWQPPKPKIEVPKIVSDWFEDSMGGTFAGVVSSYAFSSLEATEWVRDNGGIDLLCNMKLYGYTVKKEQLYEIRLPLPKDNDDDYALVDVRGDIWEGTLPTKYKMTESEVKNIDERYLAFAVEVDE